MLEAKYCDYHGSFELCGSCLVMIIIILDVKAFMICDDSSTFYSSYVQDFHKIHVHDKIDDIMPHLSYY